MAQKHVALLNPATRMATKENTTSMPIKVEAL